MSKMKQQIIIKVPMRGEKDKAKVLTIVAKTHGVTSVAIKGPEGEWVVVTGYGVDSAELTRSLRKKLGDATIVSVQNLNGRREEEDSCCYADASSTSSNSSYYNSGYYNSEQYYAQPPQCPPIRYYAQPPPQCPPVYYKVVDDPYPSYNTCSIM